MKTAEEYFESVNGGKSAEEMTKDNELITPIYGLQLMKYYAEEVKKDVFWDNFLFGMVGGAGLISIIINILFEFV